MIKKNRLIVLSVTLIAMCFSLAGCNNSNNNSESIENNDIQTDYDDGQKNNHLNEVKDNNDNSSDNEDSTLNDNDSEQEIIDEENVKNQEALASLLPEKEGYKWIYNGFVEYGHIATLNSIEENDNKIIYSLEGEVDDLSDGESDKDYTIKQRFIIENGKLTQEKEETMMMDSDFDSIVLIQMPLEVANNWEQKTSNKNGDEVTLNCFIKKIEEEEGKKIYTIRYEDVDSNYYEERRIQEGIGTISFQKLYKTDEEEFEIGYSIYMDASGY